MKPRILLAGRTRYRLPLDESLRRKFDALGEVVDLRVIGTGTGRDDTFKLFAPFRVRLFDGLVFHIAFPFRVAREIREFRPQAVVVQGAHEAAAALAARALARRRTKVVLDVHGDWKTATRLYGSPARKLLNPVADRVATFAVRRADAVRTVSDFTSSIVRAEGVEPAAEFPAFMDLDPFLEPPHPLPDTPRAVFVGVLERYKGVDVLLRAWRRVTGAQLHVVGKGTLAPLLRESPPDRWDETLPPAGVAAALDAATCLVLPSRLEGMGRVVVEAFCRGRAVVGTSAGGIPDLVRDGENGLLVEPENEAALADALERVLHDRELAERLGAGARASAERWIATPEEYAARMRALVD